MGGGGGGGTATGELWSSRLTAGCHLANSREVQGVRVTVCRGMRGCVSLKDAQVLLVRGLSEIVPPVRGCCAFLRERLVTYYLILKGVPRWCDRFGQYGIKVSFWASRGPSKS